MRVVSRLLQQILERVHERLARAPPRRARERAGIAQRRHHVALAADEQSRRCDLGCVAQAIKPVAGAQIRVQHSGCCTLEDPLGGANHPDARRAAAAESGQLAVAPEVHHVDRVVMVAQRRIEEIAQDPRMGFAHARAAADRMDRLPVVRLVQRMHAVMSAEMAEWVTIQLNGRADGARKPLALTLDYKDASGNTVPGWVYFNSGGDGDTLASWTKVYVNGDSGWVNCERCAVHSHARTHAK